MSVDSRIIHVVAGGIAGTCGSVLTCPLDVAKTRLQSSIVKSYLQRPHVGIAALSENTVGITGRALQGYTSIGLYRCMTQIIREEGVGALFKGIGPTLIGVAPSRAIYFGTYAQCKCLFTELVDPVDKSSYAVVHMFSAGTAAFASTTITNPIWLVKTRLQLDQKNFTSSMSMVQCIRQIYRQDGFVGFYKGLTASYYGISETIIHFVIYEAIKSKLIEYRLAHVNAMKSNDTRMADFLEYMLAAATSKTIATCLAYPHEVARTRMREEGIKYVRFWQTLQTVVREEGTRGIYRGLVIQLIKHIPTTAIVMSTYEAVVHFSHRYGLC